MNNKFNILVNSLGNNNIYHGKYYKCRIIKNISYGFELRKVLRNEL